MTFSSQIKQMLSGLAKPKALQGVWKEAERNGTSRLSMREINREIAAHRREIKGRSRRKHS